MLDPNLNFPPCILGIDPGLKSTGYALLCNNQALDWGCITPPAKALHSQKLKIIYDSLKHLCEKYHVNEISVESQFVQHNAMTALKLGVAKGMSLLLAAQLNLPVFEYTPTKIKKSLSGHGRSSKKQIQIMVSKQLKISIEKLPSDAADALAIALCHHWHRRVPGFELPQV